ncbi:hypothetical protein AB0C02_30510 [Micromonospora sp. NPDC048999]|uniref:hypothetical protein n=1 Tax=Micromonospora sp. NPDC048999 TaxID=3155391 RepID=UPI0034113C9D
MGDLPICQGWRNVPAGLYSRSQLADLDLPRVPAGPVRARVETRDWRDRKTTVDLHALAESEPSPATIGQLEAARRRAGTSRVCDGCGACPDRPLPSINSQHLCRVCARITELRERRVKAAADRIMVVDWARKILAPELLLPCVLRVQAIRRPAAPSGRQNPEAIALRVDAVDTAGRRLVGTTIRTAGPRVRGVPADAVDPATVEDQIRALLAAPVIVTWTSREDAPLRLLYGTDPLRLPSNPNDLSWRATYWRGDVDPDSHQFARRSAINPGRADRLLLLLRRMAATEIPDDPA